MSTLRKKVLMFGWEFPPVISGGLGVATLGLCKALAPMADVKMIIPKSVSEFSIPNITLIGLNSFTQQELDALFTGEQSNFSEYFQAQSDWSFNPYEKIPQGEYFQSKFSTVFQESVQPFEIQDLYAGDVIKKVIEFAKIAVHFGLTQTFDILHAHDWMTFLPAMELKRRTGKPFVLHVHSTEYDRSGPNSKNWVFELEREAMQYADCIIPVSRYTGKICENHYGISASKITSIHNGIEPIQALTRFKPFKEKLVIFFGRVTMQKGPSVFVEAAKIVLEHYPNVRFVMAGSGDQLNPIIEKISTYGLGDKFSFTGFLNKQKLNELLAIADVYCMPSVSEPFGLSAVEAVQYHIPTIISTTSGVAEVLDGALQFEVLDTHKFAQYIIAALEYDGLQSSVIESNAKSLKTITWEQCAEEVMQVYNKLC